LREQLSQHLLEDESSRTLLARSNALPEMQAALKEEFGSRPIN